MGCHRSNAGVLSFTASGTNLDVARLVGVGGLLGLCDPEELAADGDLWDYIRLVVELRVVFHMVYVSEPSSQGGQGR